MPTGWVPIAERLWSLAAALERRVVEADISRRSGEVWGEAIGVTSRRSGHRMLPHTADLIIEAWAPTRIGCLEEAVRALVGTFARTPGRPPGRSFTFSIAGDADDCILVSLLEEVLFVIDALSSVPVEVSLSEGADRGVTGSFQIVPIEGVETHGPGPKGVSLEQLSFEPNDDGWRCRATIDV